MRKITAYALLFVCLETIGQSMEVSASSKEDIRIISNHDLYLTGENVYLNVSCFINSKPSELSQLIYLEVIDEANTSRIKKSFHLENGQFNGSIFLPANLTTGNYAVIGYTQWSRNFSPDHFGKKMISVVNPFEPLPEGLFVNTQREAKDFSKGSLEISLSKQAYSPQDSITIDLKFNNAEETNAVLVSVHKENERSTFTNSYTLSPKSTVPTESTFIPEPKGQLLKGRVKDDNGEPKSVVISVSNELMNKIQFTTSNESGEFIIPISNHQRSNPILLKAEEAVSFEIDDPFISNHNWDIPRLEIDSSLTTWILNRAKEVQIEDEYFNEKYTAVTRVDSAGVLDYLNSKTYRLDDFTRFPRLEDPILEYIPEIKMRTKRKVKIFSVANQSFAASDSSLVLFNGVPMSSKSLFQQNPNYIETITIHPANVTFNGFEFAGIIHFKTYKKYIRTVRFFNSEKIDLSETFYEQKVGDDRLPDFKAQLLWESVETGGENQVTLKTKASMSKGGYVLNVVDDQGNLLGSKKFRVW